MPAVILVALSVGLDNFAAAIAIGLVGVDSRMRIRVALIFGLFEGGMPLVGLLIGRGLAGSLGRHAHLLGGLLLIATGLYVVISTRLGRGPDSALKQQRSLTGLLFAGAALSIDNLIVGFALGTYSVPLGAAAALIAVVSVAMSLVGLEIGARVGDRIERGSEMIGGIVLIGVGAALATRLL